MKKVIFILIYLSIAQYSFSQDDDIGHLLESIGGRINLEVQGSVNTYLVDSVKFMCLVRNKKSVYGKMRSNIGDGRVIVTVADMALFKSIVKETLSETIKKVKISEWENIDISMVSDLNGNIKDVYFTYKVRLNIPITILEQLEKRIKEECRLSFDKNLPALSHANYVSLDYPVFLQETCF